MKGKEAERDMAENLPYFLGIGTLTNALEKIKKAAVPSRFSYDFMASTLQMKGGTAKMVPPFLKRIGFLGADGTPTDLYKRFRNATESKIAMAEAIRVGYPTLYRMNESVHSVSDAELKGMVVQATGLEENSRTAQAMVGTFKALKNLADFNASPAKPATADTSTKNSQDQQEATTPARPGAGLNLSYTINLNLPATSDTAVFNAIFKSLRENLLEK